MKIWSHHQIRHPYWSFIGQRLKIPSWKFGAGRPLCGGCCPSLSTPPPAHLPQLCIPALPLLQLQDSPPLSSPAWGMWIKEGSLLYCTRLYSWSVVLTSVFHSLYLSASVSLSLSHTRIKASWSSGLSPPLRSCPLLPPSLLMPCFHSWKRSLALNSGLWYGNGGGGEGWGRVGEGHWIPRSAAAVGKIVFIVKEMFCSNVSHAYTPHRISPSV